MMDNLDKIAIEATGIETEAQAAEDAILNPEAQSAIDPAQAWAQIPKMFGGIIGIVLPEVSEAYTDAACLQWGAAMAAVAEKHQWDAAETMSRFGPEIALVVATIPLALPTIQAIKARREKPEKKAPEKAIEGPFQMQDDAGKLPEPGGFSEPK